MGGALGFLLGDQEPVSTVGSGRACRESSQELVHDL
jgi:hypothetical protein